MDCLTHSLTFRQLANLGEQHSTGISSVYLWYISGLSQAVEFCVRSFSTATMIQSKLLEYEPFILNRIHNYIKSTDGTLKKLRKHCKIKQLPPRYKNKKKNHTQNALSSRPQKLPATETLPLTQRSRQQVQGFQFFFHRS